MATMTALYGENLAPATGDPLIDRGIWKPAQDDGKRVKLRVPPGISTVFGGETGAKYQADADGVVEMSPKDAGHMSLRSWERVLSDA
jgi:hypothetical protein